jgi:hypothetical protein
MTAGYIARNGFPHGKNRKRHVGISSGKGKNNARYGKLPGNHLRKSFHRPGDEKNLPGDETRFQRNETRHLCDKTRHLCDTAKITREMKPVSQETGICFPGDEIRHPGNKKKHLGDGKFLSNRFFAMDMKTGKSFLSIL